MKQRVKKIISAILAIAMVLSLNCGALEAQAQDFTDMPADWSKTALENAVSNGLLKGSGGKLTPQASLSRAEMAAIINRAFGAQSTADISNFGDVAENSWYYAEMQKAVQMGTFRGNGSTLSPLSPITREEVFAVLARAFCLDIPAENTTEEFADAGEISGWALNGVNALAGAGYIHGNSSKLSPKAEITRAEFAQIMDNLVKTYVDADATVTEIGPGNVMLRGGSATFDGASVNGSLFLGDGVGGGKVALKNTTVDGAVLMRGGSLDVQKGSVDSVKVHNVNAPAEISGTVGNVSAEGDLTFAGNAKVITITHMGNAKIAAGASVDKVIVQADDVTITAEGKIGAVETSAANTDLNGSGKVSKFTALPGSEDAKVSTPNTTIKVDKEAGAVTVGDKTVKPGSAQTTNNKGSGITSGSSDPAPSVPQIAMNAIPDMSVQTGKTDTTTVTVDPTDVVVTAVSDKTNIATVTVSGRTITVTGVAKGSATITVEATKPGFTKATKTFTVTVTETAPEAGLREVLNFNSGWMFSKGHGFENSESNRGDKTEVVVLPKDDKPYEDSYALGNTWTSVSLPHTYNDVDTFDKFTETGMNGERSVYGGTAWYKKTFTIPKDYEGKKIFLEFEAARQAAEVYVNGEKLNGKSENGFIPFGYDLTPYLKFGAANDITVMTDNAFPYYHIGEDNSKNELSWADSHWHPNSGGLYRNAFLYVTDPLHVTLPLYSFLETQGTYVYTKNETASSADVVMEAEIQNEYNTAKTFTYVTEVRDAEGKPVLTQTSEALTLQPNTKQVFSLTGTLNNPKRWSTEYPYLYEVVSKVMVNGIEIDSTTTKLGVRTFRFTNDSGFFLNENYVKLQGWGQKPTDEWAGLGAAYPDWMHAYTQELMKNAGGNFIRWGHCAGSPSQIAISDQYGIVTLQPGVDGEGSTVGGSYSEYSYQVRKDAFRDMIVYYRNSPSIFLWEVGNQSMPDAEAKALTDIIYEFDGHGMNAADKKNSGTYAATEGASNRLIAVRRGNNVMSKYIDVSVTTEGAWELKGDGKPGVEGEYNREEARRGVWDRYTPGYENFKTPSGSSYNLTDEQFAVNQASNYAKISATAHSGGANWIFSDSTSHGRVYSEVSRASGEVDAVRLPKESYYTLQTIFTDKVDAHIVGHWNYPDNTVKDVYVVSDAFNVKLTVTDTENKTTEYTAKKTNGYVFTFQNVAYKPGTITAVGYDKNGVELTRTSKTTHGEAVALKLTPITGPEGLLANGSDVLLIDVEAVDAAGNRCLTFDGTVKKLKTEFTINDENGCSVWRGGYNSGIEMSTNNKYLYLEGGVTRVAVRTTMSAGDITVTATTAGLSSDTITVTSKAINNENGLNTELDQFKHLPLDASKDPGVGDGSMPEVDNGTVTEQKSALISNFSYSGSDAPTKISFPAIKGETVYSDDKDIVFGDLPIELLNSEYLQLPQADANLLGATDVIQLEFQRNVDLYIAHDDGIKPRPNWLTTDYRDTGMDITVGGKTHSVFTKQFAAKDSVTIFSNVDGVNFETGGNQYIVFAKEQGQEKTFLMDDFEGQAVDQAPLGWIVNTAPDTSAKIIDMDGNKVLELMDNNTGSAPNMAMVSRKFLPQSGKFSFEYKYYDYNLTVNDKPQNNVRILLHQGIPSTDPNVHVGTVLESYIMTVKDDLTKSTLMARTYPNGPDGARVDVNIKTMPIETWVTVKYIVDIEAKSYDIYVNGTLEKAGVLFRNNLPFVDHLILGSGGATGTHVLFDDVKIELIDSALSGVTINGNVLPAFAPNTLAYTYSLPVGTTQVPVVDATARDPYATVEVTQPDSVTGTGTIKVTALSGAETSYTVTFKVASEVNTELTGILLNGTALKGFNKSTTEYNIVLAPDAALPTVTVDKKDLTDVVDIATEGGTTTITVNGEGVYKLSFTNAGYELNDDFEGETLSSNWMQNTSVDKTPSTALATLVSGNGGKVLNIADPNTNMTFVHGTLANSYITAQLADKKIVMEWDLNPGTSQQWIRGLFSKGTDCLKDSTTNGKTDMAVEVYTSQALGKGNITYKNAVGSKDIPLTPVAVDGTVTVGKWNHMKLEVMPGIKKGIFRVTVTNGNGVTFTATGEAEGAVRLNNGSDTVFSYVQFGTGGGVSGDVQIDNVKVYVCSDID